MRVLLVLLTMIWFGMAALLASVIGARLRALNRLAESNTPVPHRGADTSAADVEPRLIEVNFRTGEGL